MIQIGLRAHGYGRLPPEQLADTTVFIVETAERAVAN
jgi:hypothetical protein